MQLTFYHYVHCPFCVRVRMTLGYLDLPYKSVVLPYDDEKTPVAFTGTKMLPIMVIDGKAINESLDIMAALDENNLLSIAELKKNPDFPDFQQLLNNLGKNVHNLAMPYWIYTPEFNENSRSYFQRKKEDKRGPFKELVKNKNIFTAEVLKDFTELADNLKPFYRSEKFSSYDILLASHIWGLYVVPEFQFPEKVHNYLQKIKEICRFDYHEDFWR
jgi:glutaredoxin 2